MLIHNFHIKLYKINDDETRFFITIDFMMSVTKVAKNTKITQEINWGGVLYFFVLIIVFHLHKRAISLARWQ